MATNIYSDIEFLFTKNPITNDLNRIFDETAIKQSIRNLLLTERYEKLFRPNFYSGITDELFELINPLTAQNLREKITDMITQYEPRIERVSVDVQAQPDENRYEVRVAFLPRKSLRETNFTLFLERVS